MGGKRKNSGNFKGDDSCQASAAKKSDDGDSQEELDGNEGSSTLYKIWNANNNNGVRYSARVMEKQEKLRRESSPAKQIVPTDPNAQNPVSSSTSNTSPPGTNSGLRAGGQKLETTGGYGSSDPTMNSSNSAPGMSGTGSGGGGSGSATMNPGGIGGGSSSTTPPTMDDNKQQRKKRNWELWSQKDKQLFFEGLNDYGKDFDAIQNYLACKLRPKHKLGGPHLGSGGLPAPTTSSSTNSTAAGGAAQFIPKNKDQVRHFYYRTWNKIAKYLTFPADMKKAFQELYGLVNYGELRKKQRVLNVKNSAKLLELIHKGTTTIKVRGKTLRIKTPVCRALKRLNRLDDVEHTRVPSEVSIELNAKDGKSWATVQSVAHNPRVKVHVPLQRTLSSVITFFEDRWKSSSDKLKEQFLHTFGKKESLPRLRFMPVDTKEMNLPIFKVSEVTSSAKLSLRAFTEKVLKDNGIATEPQPQTSTLKNKKKQSSLEESISERDRDREAEMNDGDASDTLYPLMTTTIASPTRLCFGSGAVGAGAGAQSAKATIEFQEKEQVVQGLPQQQAHTQGAGLFEAAATATAGGPPPEWTKFGQFGIGGPLNESIPSGTSAPKKEIETCACPPKGEEDFLSHVWDASVIQRGWTAENAGTMTCGELYLLLGQNEKLCFEYYWDTKEDVPSSSPPGSTLLPRSNNEEIRLIDRLVEVARLLKKRKSCSSRSTKSPAPPWPCANCGYKPEQNHALRSPPHQQQQQQQFLISADQAQQSTYISNNHRPSSSATASFQDLQKQMKERIATAASATINSERIPGFATAAKSREEADAGHFVRPAPRPIVAKEALPQEIKLPPKPFLDLPKGNRRIGRTPLLNRVIIPKLLPLRPKGVIAPTIAAVALVPNATARSGVDQSGQPITLLNCLKSVQQQQQRCSASVPVASAVGIATSGPLASSSLSAPSSSVDLNQASDNCISVGPSEFEDLILVKRNEKVSNDPENSFSLSSFMGISLPESSRMMATTLETSTSCDLSLSNFLDNCSEQGKDGGDESRNTLLETPRKLLETHRSFVGASSMESSLPSGGPWMSSATDTNDLSLSSLLGTLNEGVSGVGLGVSNSSRSAMNSGNNDTDVNFQSVMGEGNFNFLNKYSEKNTDNSMPTT